MTERLDDETERLINALQVAAVTDFTEELPRPAISRIYSSPEKVEALRNRIRELVEDARIEGQRAGLTSGALR